MSKRSEARRHAVRALLVAVGYCGGCAKEVRELIRNASSAEAIRTQLELLFPHFAEDNTTERVFDRLVAAFEAVLDLDSSSFLDLSKCHVLLYEKLTYIGKPSPRMIATGSHRLSNALFPAVMPIPKQRKRRRQLQAVA